MPAMWLNNFLYYIWPICSTNELLVYGSFFRLLDCYCGLLGSYCVLHYFCILHGKPFLDTSSQTDKLVCF